MSLTPRIDDIEAITDEVSSGTYTPVLTQIAGSPPLPTPDPAKYIRVGDMVQVSGRLPTPGGNYSHAMEMGISLPFASNFTTVGELTGNATTYTVTSLDVQMSVEAEPVSDVANLRFGMGGSNGFPVFYQFMYRII